MMTHDQPQAQIERNKGGRPTKNPDELVEKTKSISSTQDELRRLDRIHKIMTAGTKKSFSSFAKEVIFSLEQAEGRVAGNQTTSYQIGKLTMELGYIKKELRSIGALYNQVVKRINSLYVSAELKQESQQHNKLFSQIEPLISQINKLIEQIEK